VPPPRYRADALAPSLQIPPVHPVIDERLAGAVTEQHCDGREMCADATETTDARHGPGRTRVAPFYASRTPGRARRPPNQVAWGDLKGRCDEQWERKRMIENTL